MVLGIEMIVILRLSPRTKMLHPPPTLLKKIAFPLLALVVADLKHAAAQSAAAQVRPRPASPGTTVVPTDDPDPDRVPTKVPLLESGARLEDEQNTIAVFRIAAASVVFVTNYHVVIGTGARLPAGVTVQLHNGQKYLAKIAGVDQSKNIALLKIEAPASALIPLPRPAPGTRLEVG